jgi:hypothetical protein
MSQPWDYQQCAELKVQCREMVVDMRPWSGRLDQNLWSQTLFYVLKSAVSKLRSVQKWSIDLKPVLQIHRIRLYPWAYHAVMAVICQWSHNHCANSQHSRSCFCASCQKSLVHFSQLWQFAVILCLTVYASWWSSSRVVAKSAESGEPVFLLMDVLLYGL